MSVKRKAEEEIPSATALNRMNCYDLRQLAEQHGIQTNQKKAELITQLKLKKLEVSPAQKKQRL